MEKEEEEEEGITVPFVCLITGNSPLDQVEALNFFARCGENEEFASDTSTEAKQCAFNVAFINPNCGSLSYSRKTLYYPVLTISSDPKPATNVYNCATMVVNKPIIELGNLNCNIDSISQIYKSTVKCSLPSEDAIGEQHEEDDEEEEEEEDKGMACSKCALGTEKCFVKANVFRLNSVKEKSLNDSLLIVNSKSVCETRRPENIKTESQFIQCTQEMDGTPIPLSCAVSSILYVKRSNFWFSEPERAIAWLFKSCTKVHSSFHSGECIMFAGPDDMVSKPIGNRLGWNKENVFTHKYKGQGQFLVSIPPSYYSSSSSSSSNQPENVESQEGMSRQRRVDNDWHFKSLQDFTFVCAFFLSQFLHHFCFSSMAFRPCPEGTVATLVSSTGRATTEGAAAQKEVDFDLISPSFPDLCTWCKTNLLVSEGEIPKEYDTLANRCFDTISSNAIFPILKTMLNAEFEIITSKMREKSKLKGLENELDFLSSLELLEEKYCLKGAHKVVLEKDDYRTFGFSAAFANILCSSIYDEWDFSSFSSALKRPSSSSSSFQTTTTTTGSSEDGFSTPTSSLLYLISDVCVLSCLAEMSVRHLFSSPDCCSKTPTYDISVKKQQQQRQSNESDYIHSMVYPSVPCHFVGFNNCGKMGDPKHEQEAVSLSPKETPLDSAFFTKIRCDSYKDVHYISESSSSSSFESEKESSSSSSSSTSNDAFDNNTKEKEEEEKANAFKFTKLKCVKNGKTVMHKVVREAAEKGDVGIKIGPFLNVASFWNVLLYYHYLKLESFIHPEKCRYWPSNKRVVNDGWYFLKERSDSDDRYQIRARILDRLSDKLHNIRSFPLKIFSKGSNNNNDIDQQQEDDDDDDEEETFIYSKDSIYYRLVAWMKQAALVHFTKRVHFYDRSSHLLIGPPSLRNSK